MTIVQVQGDPLIRYESFLKLIQIALSIVGFEVFNEKFNYKWTTVATILCNVLSFMGFLSTMVLSWPNTMEVMQTLAMIAYPIMVSCLSLINF